MEQNIDSICQADYKSDYAFRLRLRCPAVSLMASRRPRLKISRRFLGVFILLLPLLFLKIETGRVAIAQDSTSNYFVQTLTNVSQFQTLSAQDYVRGCPFNLTGIVTMVDTNRNLLVLQDQTGAIAINDTNRANYPEPGQFVTLASTNGSPYVPSFPNYPYRPSGWDMRSSFEAPANWGNYHLTRMRGYLHPQASGDYTFWIASDNSGELWLSPDDDPGKVKRIALLKSGEWVNQREWSRYPWQQSEPIVLKGGSVYYIEAFEEQLTLDDNLAVAWEGPGLQRSVISGYYLSPFIAGPDQARYEDTAKIFREYWTNYTAGTLEPVTGARPFASVLTAKNVQMTVQGQGAWPEPKEITIDRQLNPADNYGWVKTEGLVSFSGRDKDGVVIELTDGRTNVEVHVSNWKGELPPKGTNWIASVQGVCEGVLDNESRLVPGSIWVPSGQDVSFWEASNTTWPSLGVISPYQFTTSETNVGDYAGGGFLAYLSMRGTVTFNDRVLDKDCLFIQDDTAGIFVSQADYHWGDLLQVGQWVTFGGNLQSGKYSPSLHPLLEWTLGWRPMPAPSTDPIGPAVAPSRDGQWTELEGVVRSVNPNGTMTLMGVGGPVQVWIGHQSTENLGQFVDSTLRLRGVLSLSLWDNPMLLVPSTSFVDEKEKPENPSGMALRPIASLSAINSGASRVHRVKIKGTVVYQADRLLFVEDDSGSIRVNTPEDMPAQVGDSVEVIGFPEYNGLYLSMTDVRVKPAGARIPVVPKEVDFNTANPNKYDGMLVQSVATLLVHKKSAEGDILELQEGQSIFVAVNTFPDARLPSFRTGSILRLKGICDTKVGVPATVKRGDENMSISSVFIRLRDPSDVVLLWSPSILTFKNIAVAMSILLFLLVVLLARIYLSRRQLQKQQIMQSAFSRQMLENQENERGRIAANLHDSLGQSLLVIKNQALLTMQSAKDESVIQQRLNDISEIASQAVEEVRQITHDLRPYQLDRLGLTHAIRAIIQRAAENSHIQFASHVDDIDGILARESEIHVYRIAQESLNNIIKHSAAAEATVVIKKQTAEVSMSFRDNGRGFDTNPSTTAGQLNAGFGLGGIAERAKILGGRMNLESQPGKGADLKITIPIMVSTDESETEINNR